MDQIMVVSLIVTSVFLAIVSWCFIFYIFSNQKRINHLKEQRDFWKESYHEMTDNFNQMSTAQKRTYKAFVDLEKAYNALHALQIETSSET